ncbi:hypothetical protein EDC96DRAFT_449370 [Choanephora cucurbitarum]|nr:hypothetical protein EDC96DRAFT_449370 [Choanephora cucurbitarum]
MSGIDTRLLEALRAIRNGTWVYGANTGLSHLLGDYCTQLGLPRHLGDPVTGRIACTLVHEGKPYGCEANVLLRFYRGFAKIFPVYLSVHLFPPLFFKTSKLVQNPGQFISHVLFASVRSSTFLATYIAIIWYSICLVRTRIGHQLLGINQTRLDNTMAPLVGSMLCGLSLLIESRHRRGEMTLYVLPRALYSFTERILSPHQKGRWWEHKTAAYVESVTFALSVTTVVDAVYHNRQLVRPSFRSILSWILQIKSTSGQSTPIDTIETENETDEEEEEGLVLRKKSV